MPTLWRIELPAWPDVPREEEFARREDTYSAYVYIDLSFEILLVFRNEWPFLDEKRIEKLLLLR